MAGLAGKIGLVVGGAKSIGFTIAERMAAEGATVYLTGRDRDEVERAAARIGKGARGLVADAGAPEEMARAVAAVMAQAGRIDALVLNAGMSAPALLMEETVDNFDHLFAVNVRSHVFAFQAAAGAMKQGGSVVIIGSVATAAGAPTFGTYAATKAALRSYIRSWTAELAPQGIRVNMVSPGPTADTGMQAANSEDVRAAMIPFIPLGRFARADEVASATVFLLSDQASYIAGVELFVDGGMAQV